MAVVTEQADVYLAVLQALQQSEWISETSNIYIAYQAMFDPTQNTAIQIIPGAPVVAHPDSGIPGLITEEFEVAVWKKVMLDRVGQSTSRLTDISLGMLRLVHAVRRTLIQSWLEGNATVPIVLMQGSAASEHEEDVGWVMMTDTYRVGYEIRWDVEDEP